MIRLLKQNKVSNKIFLHSMPGRNEPIQDIGRELENNQVSLIICLADYSNIKRYSVEYCVAVKKGQLAGIEIRYSPVPDFGVPETDTEYFRYDFMIHEAVDRLSSGNILIHCGAGIGRTGTFAIILLRALGYSFRDAKSMTLQAGSEPETDDQLDFCEHYLIRN